MAAEENRRGTADDQVALILRPKGAAADEAHSGRCDFIFPTELGIFVMRHRLAIGYDKLAANLAARMGGGVQIGVSSALTNTFDQVRNGIGEARARYQLGVV